MPCWVRCLGTRLTHSKTTTAEGSHWGHKGRKKVEEMIAHTIHVWYTSILPHIYHKYQPYLPFMLGNFHGKYTSPNGDPWRVEKFLDVSPSIVFSLHWPTLPAFFAALPPGVPWQHWHLPPQRAEVDMKNPTENPLKIHSKSMEIYGNLWKSTEHTWKSYQKYSPLPCHLKPIFHILPLEKYDKFDRLFVCHRNLE